VVDSEGGFIWDLGTDEDDRMRRMGVDIFRVKDGSTQIWWGIQSLGSERGWGTTRQLKGRSRCNTRRSEPPKDHN
jgi:hypothetical protein